MIFVTMEETDLLSRTSYYTFHDVQDEDGDDGSDSDSGEFRLSRPDPCEDAEMDLLTPPHFLTDSESVDSPRRDAPSSSSLWTNLSEHINLSRPPPPVQLVPQAIFRHKEKKAQWTIDFEPAMHVSPASYIYLFLANFAAVLVGISWPNSSLPVIRKTLT
jgi:hypothetical protein